MIRCTRLLSFEHYAASNRFALLHGPFWRRFNYVAMLRVLPVLGMVLFLPGLWMAVRTWNAPGYHAVGFGGLCMLVFLCGYYGCLPLFFRRRLRKLYRQQELDQPWTIEISAECILNTVPGKQQTRFEWAFFNCYTETPEVFTLLQKQRLIFLTVGKDSLKDGQVEELRALLAAHLKAEC